MTHANSAVLIDISQSQRVAYCIAAGCSAHNQPDHTATRRLKQRAAISHVASAVAAEKTQLIASSTHAEAAV